MATCRRCNIEEVKDCPYGCNDKPHNRRSSSCSSCRGTGKTCERCGPFWK